MPSGEAIIANPNKFFEFMELINKRYCQAHNEENTVEKEKEYAITLLDKLKKDHDNTSLTIYQHTKDGGIPQSVKAFKNAYLKATRHIMACFDTVKHCGFKSITRHLKRRR